VPITVNRLRISLPLSLASEQVALDRRDLDARPVAEAPLELADHLVGVDLAVVDAARVRHEQLSEGGLGPGSQVRGRTRRRAGQTGDRARRDVQVGVAGEADLRGHRPNGQPPLLAIREQLDAVTRGDAKVVGQAFVDDDLVAVRCRSRVGETRGGGRAAERARCVEVELGHQGRRLGVVAGPGRDRRADQRQGAVGRTRGIGPEVAGDGVELPDVADVDGLVDRTELGAADVADRRVERVAHDEGRRDDGGAERGTHDDQHGLDRPADDVAQRHPAQVPPAQEVERRQADDRHQRQQDRGEDDHRAVTAGEPAPARTAAGATGPRTRGSPS
jgi:hypothetical protein